MIGIVLPILGSAPAYAYTVMDTVTDYASNVDVNHTTAETYIGALPPSGYGDVVSNSPTDTNSLFEIKRVDGTLTTTGASTASLTLSVYTNYNASLPAALGTTFGDLFLTSALDWHPMGPGAAPSYVNDQLDPLGATGSKWDYALVLGNTFDARGDGQSSSGGAELYTIDNGDIQTSYDGSLTCPSSNFRCYQPVEYKGGGVDKGIGGSFTVASNPGGTVGSADGLYLLTFVIDNISTLGFGNNLTGYEVAFSWAMTCSNDVIQGLLSFAPPTDENRPVPLPAAFPLFAFAVGGLGVAGRWRKRRNAAA